VELALVTFPDLLADLFAEQDLIEYRLLLFGEHVDKIALRALDWVGLLLRLLRRLRNLAECFADLRHFDELLAAIGAEGMLARELSEVDTLLQAVGTGSALIFLLKVSQLANQKLKLLDCTEFLWWACWRHIFCLLGLLEL
jgi:hypothetical protein